MLNDYGKLYLLGLAMILSFIAGIVLILVGETLVGATLVSGNIGTIVGYITGNGILAARGEAPSPVYTPTPDALVEKAINDLEDAANDS